MISGRGHPALARPVVRRSGFTTGLRFALQYPEEWSLWVWSNRKFYAKRYDGKVQELRFKGLAPKEVL